MTDQPLAPLVAICGPTGSGKSELALRISEEFGGEVVNCDSLQIYRYFDIGTAKLPLEERRGIPHHLIDILNPDEVFTAGEYARRAREVLLDITSRGKLPVVAGGTGFYLRALIDGLFDGPPRDRSLRARLTAREQSRPGSLHRILSRLDPDGAHAIHPNDVPKVIRALEVYLLTRRPMSEWYRAPRNALTGYRPLLIGLNPPRDALYEKLNMRCAQMFEGGLAAEVQSILDKGFPAAAKPFESHGYRQTLQILNGELSPSQALCDAQCNTRRYAKRQLTWFRQDARMVWLNGFGSEATPQVAALDLSTSLLSR